MFSLEPLQGLFLYFIQSLRETAHETVVSQVATDLGIGRFALDSGGAGFESDAGNFSFPLVLKYITNCCRILNNVGNISCLLL